MAVSDTTVSTLLQMIVDRLARNHVVSLTCGATDADACWEVDVCADGGNQKPEKMSQLGVTRGGNEVASRMVSTVELINS